MSILNELMAAAAAQLRITDEEIEPWLETTVADLEDAATDRDLRAIRQRQLDNPTRSSTPIHQQILNSYWRLNAIEEKARPLLVALLPKLFAIEVQNRRIEKLKQAQADEREADRAANTTLHDGYRAFCDALMRLGATPTKLGDLRQEEHAILADLIRWKIADTGFDDPDNPWRALYAHYAGRTMERGPQGKRAPPVSQPGVPPPDETGRGGKRFWRFARNSAVKDVGPIVTGDAAVSGAIAIAAPNSALAGSQDVARSHADTTIDLSKPVASSIAGKSHAHAVHEDAAQLGVAHAKRRMSMREAVETKALTRGPAEVKEGAPRLGSRSRPAPQTH